MIAGVFAFTGGAKKLSEREGRAQAGSGVKMLEPGMRLVPAPVALNRIGVAFALVGVALGVTWLAARLTRE